MTANRFGRLFAVSKGHKLQNEHENKAVEGIAIAARVETDFSHYLAGRAGFRWFCERGKSDATQHRADSGG